MPETIFLITWNQSKLNSAKKCIEDFGLDIDIQMESFETPEIQSFDNKEIAAFSAKYIADKLQKTVLVSDVGYFINALNGFPWPYIKRMNQRFTAEQILDLMGDKEDRSFVIKEAIAFCRVNEEPVVFELCISGLIAYEAVGQGSTIDQIGILEWQNVVVGMMNQDDKLAMRAKHNPLNLFLEWYQTSKDFVV